ncbi:MAG TPA: hypothetical protein VIY51_10635 [Xanthobacteraceae bacterium]
MNIWTLSPWLARLVILAVAGLFTMISFKFVLDPQQAAASSGITLDSAIGYTNARAGFGGFPLGFAAILLFCLLSSRRHLAALASIATVAAVILAVRLYGAEQDGTYRESAHLLIPEAAIFIVSLLAALLETRRRSPGVEPR